MFLIDLFTTPSFKVGDEVIRRWDTWRRSSGEILFVTGISDDKKLVLVSRSALDVSTVARSVYVAKDLRLFHRKA